MKKILSIDGGGIRGIIPAIVLKEIEKETGQAAAETFDLIAGTSTGGILALGLSKHKGGGTQDRYKAEDLVNIYKKRGNEIFGSESRRNTSNLGSLILSVEQLIQSTPSILKDLVEPVEQLVNAVKGLDEPIYANDGLIKVLKCYFGEATLKNVHQGTKVMVTCYDIKERRPVFLKSWYPTHSRVKMQEAALATSAAPTYFQPVQLQIGNKKPTLIDGGVFINSPAVSAYAEAKNLFPEEDIFVLSLGTGTFTKPFEYKEAKDWGKLEWFFPFLDCLFDGMLDAADYQMDTFLGKSNYFRLTGDLSDDNDKMNDVEADNIASLEAVAKGIIESNNFGKCLNRLEQLKE